MPKDKKKDKLSEGDRAIVAKVGVDNTFRRTWDKEEFAAKAAAREKKVRAATLLAMFQMWRTQLQAAACLCVHATAHQTPLHRALHTGG